MALWATSPKRASLVLTRQTASSEHPAIGLSLEDCIVDPEARISPLLYGKKSLEYINPTLGQVSKTVLSRPDCHAAGMYQY